MNWTDERVELLRKMWEEGQSASQIAVQLGGVTRNAVIGKVHRLKIKRLEKTPPSTSAKKDVDTFSAAKGAMAGEAVIGADAKGKAKGSKVKEAEKKSISSKPLEEKLPISRISVVAMKAGVANDTLSGETDGETIIKEDNMTMVGEEKETLQSGLGMVDEGVADDGTAEDDGVADEGVADEGVIVPISRRLNLLQLTDSTCKWPIGDPLGAGFHFCGAKTCEGSPYCSYHSKIAFQPLAERRRIRV